MTLDNKLHQLMEREKSEYRIGDRVWVTTLTKSYPATIKGFTKDYLDDKDRVIVEVDSTNGFFNVSPTQISKMENKS